MGYGFEIKAQFIGQALVGLLARERRWGPEYGAPDNFIPPLSVVQGHADSVDVWRNRLANVSG